MASHNFLPYERPEGRMVSAAVVIRRPLNGMVLKPGHGNRISIDVAREGLNQVRMCMQVMGADGLAGIDDTA